MFGLRIRHGDGHEASQGEAGRDVIKGGAKIDHETPGKRRFVAVQK
jgi:hypothetical protein